MNVPQELIPIFGPITAAIIAGSISFIITVLSKDQKTSEFRQAWIDHLREDISELLAIFSLTISVISRKSTDGATDKELLEYALSRQNEIGKMHQLAIKIRLRLNPNEHKLLLGSLDKLENEEWSPEKNKEVDELITSITSESQIILKKEWSRVKSGETSFRAVKWTSLIIFITSSVFAFLYLNDHIKIEYIS
jgi:hypothetical protein